MTASDPKNESQAIQSLEVGEKMKNSREGEIIDSDVEEGARRPKKEL